jgi:hypothetical protein
MTKKSTKKTNFIERFNDYIAERLSFVLSVMATFYIVLTLTIVPLFYGLPSTPKDWATYLCTVIFQGIALPVLGYTSRKAGDKSDAVMAEVLRLTKEIDRLVKMIEKQEEHIHQDVEEIKSMEQQELKDLEGKNKL